MSRSSVVYYTTGSGRNPVRDFIDRLDTETAAQILYDLELLADYGLALGMPHVRHLEGKIWELRTVFTGNQHRVVFAPVGGGFLLLHAFSKKAQKTLRRDIELAQNRLKDYLVRGRP